MQIATRKLIPVIVAACLSSSIVGCGTNVDSANTAASTIIPVYIVGTDYLAGSPGGGSAPRTPEKRYPLNPAAPSSNRYAAFELSVVCSSPDRLTLKLANSLLGIDSELKRLPAPDPSTTDDTAIAAATLVDFPITNEMRDLLASGVGGYTLLETTENWTGPSHRLALLVPEDLLRPSARIDIFAQANAEGIPIRADSIELAAEFYNMAVIGDSILWGNGLKEHNKFPTIVASEIEIQLGVKVISQVRAQSSASIVPSEFDYVCSDGCWGEAPMIPTSITAQVDLIENPEQIDLVLMDGCINDVSFMRILDPSTTHEEIIELTEQFCHQEMVTLLEKVRQTFPNAHIVVTSYFPIVGNNADLFGLEFYTELTETGLDSSLATLKESMVSNSQLFDDLSREALAAAVSSANTSDGENGRFSFAEVPFTAEHGVFSPQPWLWGLSNEEDLLQALELPWKLIPEDPVLQQRIDYCLDGDGFDGIISCLFASVGHPNVEGAKIYASSVLDQLFQSGTLPEAPPTD